MAVNHTYMNINDFRLMHRIYKNNTKTEAYIMHRLPELVSSSKSIDDVRDSIENELKRGIYGLARHQFSVGKHVSARIAGSEKVYYAIYVSYGKRFISMVSETIK